MLIVCLLALAGCSDDSTTSSKQPNSKKIRIDQSTPEATVRSFYRAVNAQRFDLACKLYTSRAQDRLSGSLTFEDGSSGPDYGNCVAGFEGRAQASGLAHNPPKLSPGKLRTIKNDGDSAVLGVPLKGIADSETEYYFVRKGDKWLIDVPAQKAAPASDAA